MARRRARARRPIVDRPIAVGDVVGLKEGHARYRPSVISIRDGQAKVGNLMLAGVGVRVFPLKSLEHAANLPRAQAKTKRADAPE